MEREHLDWPFFEERHRRLAAELDDWAAAQVHDAHGDDVDATCRMLVARLAEAGLLRHVVPAAYGGVGDRLDVRSLCLVRETLALRSFADDLRELHGRPTDEPGERLPAPRQPIARAELLIVAEDDTHTAQVGSARHRPQLCSCEQHR